MPWALGLIKTNGGGIPDLDTQTYKYHGHVYIGSVAGWGAYLISGTAAQLTAINALPQAVGIAVLTHPKDGPKWVELDSNVTTAIRNKLNTWLGNNGYPTIPAGWTNRLVVETIFRRLNPAFDLEKEWVADS
jgi:hypothetical protein